MLMSKSFGQQAIQILQIFLYNLKNFRSSFPNFAIKDGEAKKQQGNKIFSGTKSIIL